MKKMMWAGAAALALASCGGGGGSSGGSSGGGSGAGSGGGLAVTSGTSFSILEGNVGPVQLSANRSGVTYSISGEDAGLFDLDGDIIQFRAVPSYESPFDADGDNVYRFDLTVSVGGESETVAITVTVQNDSEGVVVTRVASGLGNIVAATQVGFDRVVVTDENGNMKEYNNSTGVMTDLGQAVNVDLGGGGAIVALGWSQDSEDGKLWAVLDRNAGETHIVLWNKGIANAPLEVTNFMFSDPGEIHATMSGDRVGFGDNGDPASAADRNSVFGTIQRLVRQTDPAGNETASLEYVAHGFHRPYVTSTWWLDQGEQFDEGNEWMWGGNFQWPTYDGNMPTAFAGSIPTTGTPQPPAITIPRGDGPRQSAGLIGSATGLYVTADRADVIMVDRTGNFFTFNQPRQQELGLGLEPRNEDFTPNAGTITQPVFMGLLDDQPVGGSLRFPVIVDRDGEIYVVTGTI